MEAGRRWESKKLREGGRKRKREWQGGRRMPNNPGKAGADASRRQGEQGHVGARIATKAQQSKDKVQKSLKSLASK